MHQPINTVRNLGGSAGISLAATLIARREQYHQSVLIEHVTSLSNQYEAVLHGLQQTYPVYSAGAVGALHRVQAQVYMAMQKQTALLSFNDCFWILAVILGAMLPIVLLVQATPRY
jgi:MFS transporter, DHA2 family, multidrug resistance protein